MADSIREALSKAMADDESTTTETTTTPEPAPVVETNESVIPAPNQAIGSPAPEPVKAAAAEAPVTGKPPTAEVQTAPAAAVPVVAAIAAPSSWKTAEKTFWDKMPAEAKAAVQRRELETQRALSASADARKANDTFKQTLAPYQPLLDAYGVTNPIDALVPLMQTRAALEVGTDDQKAQLIANLVHQFKVDVSKLDGFLVSGPMAQVPQQTQQLDYANIPQLAPLFQMAEQVKQAQVAKVDAALNEIATRPHFNDVREDMADLMDMAAQRGRQMTLQQAYDIAAASAGLAPVAQHATTTSEAAAILARSRKAASSVAGAPKGQPGAKPTSLRDSIEAAMNG